ncbi:hypothetical protein LEP3755_50610 [Leptolyngbya sp. NIES-3755]|nr:hypothetical protein LEP3755_50610 [Leptolyngbya sp. NIES-3755]
MVERSFDPLRTLETENSEDLEAMMKILSKLTRLPSEQIKPRLESLLTSLLDLQTTQSDSQEDSERWTQRFTDWVEGHRSLELPSLSDEAISRESIYGDDR